jgi:poly(ADP-ribose) glycohydrolase ARH3
MERVTHRAKFRGALVGAAVGDALGAPFEGMATVPPATLSALGHARGPLRFTDDTHMTLGLAQSLVERRGFDGAHMAAAFARNFAAEPWRGYGAGPPEVFRRLEAGVPWDQAARTLFGGDGSFGNGAAMRVAPVALLTCPRLPETAWLARQTARITHAHPLGIEGAVLQACAITLLLQHSPAAPLDVARFLRMVQEPLEGPSYPEALDLIGRRLAAGDRNAGPEFGHGVAATEAVPAALYAFLRTPDSFAEVIRYAIGLGGDTDTIASMAGALAGAYLGEEAIPACWRGEVEGADELRRLADALLDLAAAGVRGRPRPLPDGG